MNTTMGLNRKTGMGPAWALAVGAALSLAACSHRTSEPSGVAQIEWTSSFGFCPPTSYCTTRLRVSGAEAVVTLESRESPTRRNSVQLTGGEADALARAAAQARFDGLGPVIGCPDCADGGAETLSVTGAGGTQTVTFEFSASVGALEPLLGRMRGLAERLRPQP